MENIEYIDTAKGRAALVTLTNAQGMRVRLSAIGAGILEVWVPAADGNLVDVALGYADPADYVGDIPCCGKVPGRYANRISRGIFTLDGQEYTLEVNCGPNCLHGGSEGFHNRIWELESSGRDYAVFRLVSPDGDGGFPGQVSVYAKYCLTDDNSLELTFTAATDAPTVLNLTNHVYWNLGGHDSGAALKQCLWLAASQYLPIHPTEEVPLPHPEPVKGTPMDFTAAKTLEHPGGYDHCWVIDNPGNIKPIARLSDKRTSINLTVSSDMPGVQVYTGGCLECAPTAKGNAPYGACAGVAIECQDFPNAPNTPGFPSTVLRPGQTYRRTIKWKFDIVKNV